MTIIELKNDKDFKPFFVEVLYYNTNQEFLSLVIWQDFDPTELSFRGYLIQSKVNDNLLNFLKYLKEDLKVECNYTILNIGKQFKDWVNTSSNIAIYFEEYKIKNITEVLTLKLSIPFDGYISLLHPALYDNGYIYDEEENKHPIKLVSTSRRHLALNVQIVKNINDKQKQISLISLINSKDKVRKLELKGFAAEIVSVLKSEPSIKGWFNPKFIDSNTVSVEISTVNSMPGNMFLEVGDNAFNIKSGLENLIGKEILINILCDNFYLDIKYNTLLAIRPLSEETNFIKNDKNRISEDLGTTESYVNPGVGKIYSTQIREWLYKYGIYSDDREILSKKFKLLEERLKEERVLTENKVLNELEIFLILNTINDVIKSNLSIEILINQCKLECSRATLNNISLRTAILRNSIINFSKNKEIINWSSSISPKEVHFLF